MSEERLKGLEYNHNELKDTIKRLADSHSELADRQAKSEKLLATLMAKIDARFEDDKNKDVQHEITLRHVDDNVQKLAIAISEQKYERNREMTALMAPQWDHIRKLEKTISDHRLYCEQQRLKTKDDVKIEMRKELKTFLTGIVLVLGLTGIFAGYLYVEVIGQIHKNTDNISVHHEQHHNGK